MSTTTTHVLGRHSLNRIARERFRRHCRPHPRLTMSEWAAQYRVIKDAPWRNSQCPEWVLVMDVLGDRFTQEITVVAPSQSGKTEVGVNACGYFAHQEPSPVLVVLPTGKMAESFSKDRLQPMFTASPALSKLVAPARSRDSGNTILSKQYPGGQVDMVGAESASGLSMRPKRVVILDERDRHPSSADGEGDVKAITRARTRSFQRRRKIYEVSSPTDEDNSLIWKSYLEGTQEVFQVPCPTCDHFQVLVFENLKWAIDEAGKVLPESVHYECAACKAHIQTGQREAMKARGRWVSTGMPRVPFKRSFRLHGLLATFVLWDEVAQEFVTANGQKDLALRAEMLRAFFNTTLGELYKDQQTEAAKADLLARALPYDAREPVEGQERWRVPREAALLAAGMDLQHDRGEIVVRAFGIGEESWLIERVILRGDTSQSTFWAQLEQWRTQSTWLHESGARLQVRSMCIDAGDGSHAKAVYNYTAPRLSQHVYAIKGSSNPSAPLTPLKFTKVKPGRLYMLGVNGLMDRVRIRLGMTGPGPGYMHLNESCDLDYVTQLLSMRRVIDPKTRKRRWEATPNIRNEVADCEAYALAALLLGPVPVSAMAAEVQRVNDEGAQVLRELQDPTLRVEPEPEPAPRQQRSFVHGWK